MSPTYSICKNHGYLAGEQYVCPECGEKTEVYSRITGYYRPVQNWNDGKTQEFKDRKLYDIGRSKLTHRGPLGECACAEEKPQSKSDTVRRLLFTTKTCPNCRIAGAMLSKAHVAYETVDAEEQAELAMKYGVKQAPTLIVLGKDGVEKLTNASNIKKYAESL